MVNDEWTDQAARVSDLFTGIMFKTLSQRLISELTDKRVSLPQIQAMRFIWLHHHVLIGDLADGLAISYPSATNMVNRLEKQELVERIINPSDRREVEVQLTGEGVALTSRMEDERIARLKEVLSRMQVDDRKALLHGLSEFILAAVDNNEDEAQKICLRCGTHASKDCPVAASQILSDCK